LLHIEDTSQKVAGFMEPFNLRVMVLVSSIRL